MYRSLSEITSKMLHSITEKGQSQFEAWNESSVPLINVAKVYTSIYVANSFVAALAFHPARENQQAMAELFELFMLYDICDNYAMNVLRAS